MLDEADLAKIREIVRGAILETSGTRPASRLTDDVLEQRLAAAVGGRDRFTLREASDALGLELDGRVGGAWARLGAAARALGYVRVRSGVADSAGRRAWYYTRATSSRAA